MAARANDIQNCPNG